MNRERSEAHELKLLSQSTPGRKRGILAIDRERRSFIHWKQYLRTNSLPQPSRTEGRVVRKNRVRRSSKHTV